MTYFYSVLRKVLMTDQCVLNILGQIGRLLDEAVDLADGASETLIAAQIAQTLHLLDERISRMHADATTTTYRPADPRALED